MKEGHNPDMSEFAEKPRAAEDGDFAFKFVRDREKRLLLAQRIEQLCDKIHDDQPTVLVFLDRSARPLAYLLREIWINKFGSTPLPQIIFLNIGRNKEEIIRQGLTKRQLEAANFGYNMERLSPAAYTRALSENELIEVRKRLTTLTRNTAESTPDPRVLIIDEHSESGSTINVAKKIIQGVTPRAQISDFMVSQREGAGEKIFETGKVQHGVPEIHASWGGELEMDEFFGDVGVIGPDPTKLTSETISEQSLRRVFDRRIQKNTELFERSVTAFLGVVRRQGDYLQQLITYFDKSFRPWRDTQRVKSFIQEQILSPLRDLLPLAAEILNPPSMDYQSLRTEESKKYLRLYAQYIKQYRQWEKNLSGEACFATVGRIFRAAEIISNSTGKSIVDIKLAPQIPDYKGYSQELAKLRRLEEDIPEIIKKSRANSRQLRLEMHEIGREYFERKEVSEKSLREAA